MSANPGKLRLDPIFVKVSELLRQHLQNLGVTIPSADLYDGLVEPPNADLGDLAFGCFIAAKQLKVAPPALANQLALALKQDPFIQEASAAGPYLNLRLVPSVYEELLNEIISGQYFTRPLSKNSPKTMIEYSQPNTHKELHVGHMRNLSLGDAITKLLQYAGYSLIRSTFPGDMGTHVAKCLWYMQNKNTETPPKEHKGEWLGRMYSKANNLLEDEENTEFGPKNKEALTQIIRELENKSGPYYDLWKTTREWSIELMREVYQWADVQFDHWYFESEVDAASVALVKKYYAEGKLNLSQGAIGMDLEAEGLGFCLLLKSDGTGLYATKDIELARRKFEDFAITKSIYVVDVRQSLHFQQVFKTLEKLGFQQAKDCVHLPYNYVELPSGAMSSRKGNIVPLTDLIEQMQKTVKENYLNRYQGDWSQAEIDQVAHVVSLGAIKFGMLRIDNNKKIVFQMDEWLKIEGPSGPFVQYAVARVNSLCRKLEFDPERPTNMALLTTRHEHQLINKLLQFNSLTFSAAESYRPFLLCHYLFELAQKFNSFYAECPINQAETEELKWARLKLSRAVGLSLKKGLELLGIPSPERM